MSTDGEVSKRIRTDVWKFEGSLMEFWAKGMVAVATPEQKSLVADCCAMTGLTYCQIKDWIGNRKKKVQKSSILNDPAATVYSERRKSAKDIYFSEILPGLNHLPPPERLSTAAAQWMAIRGTNDALKYKEQIKNFKKLSDVSPTDERGKSARSKTLEKKLLKILGDMEKSGEEIVVLSCGHQGQVNRFGTQKGIGFLEKRPDIVSQFLAFIGDEEVGKIPTAALRRRVVQLFNKLYREATGEFRCSFKSVAEMKLTVEGMPDHIDFCHPRRYGRKKLLSILEKGQNIKFCRSPVMVCTEAPATETGCDEPLASPSYITVSTDPVLSNEQEPPACASSSGVIIDLSDLLIPEGYQESLATISHKLLNLKSKSNKQEPPSCTSCNTVAINLGELLIPEANQESTNTMSHPAVATEVAIESPIQNSKSNQAEPPVCTSRTTRIDGNALSVSEARRTKRKLAVASCSGEEPGKKPVYIVEELLDERKRGRRVEYLVKWKGYDSSFDSWEPRSSFMNMKAIEQWKPKLALRPRPN